MQPSWGKYGQMALGVIGLYYCFVSIYVTQAFLIPLTAAFILALVVLPLAQRLEQWGASRLWSSVIGTLTVLLIFGALVVLMAYQSKVFVDQWSSVQQVLQPKIQVWQAWVAARTPLTESELTPSMSDFFQWISRQGNEIAGALGAFVGFLGNYLLMLIYTFFFLQYRARFRQFLLHFFAAQKQEEVDWIIQQSARIAPQYLIGKLILMVGLAVLYSLGLGLAGVKNFILISLIASILTLIPYVGNVLGFGLALIFGYFTTGSTGALVGIVVTFGAGQFVESYVFYPFVIGDKVDLHPFFTILAVVAGNFLWGVIGTILFIPLLGILTVVCLHVPSLHSIGILLSTKDFEEGEGSG